MKTTQSGFEGYIVDEYTTLKPTRDRVMSTKIFCEYHFSNIEDFDKIDFSKIYDAVQQVSSESGSTLTSRPPLSTFLATR